MLIWFGLAITGRVHTGRFRRVLDVRMLFAEGLATAGQETIFDSGQLRTQVFDRFLFLLNTQLDRCSVGGSVECVRFIFGFLR